MTLLSSELELIRRTQPTRVTGVVRTLRGLTVLVEELPAPVGALVSIRTSDGRRLGEVVGFARDDTAVMLLGSTEGIRPGDRVVCEQSAPLAATGEELLGRVLDGLGRPIDGGPMPTGLKPRPLVPDPVSAMARGRITSPIRTGVRAIDLMTPMGSGQRLGIFAGPGVGKSTLLGSIARGTSADVNVIALIGERGREVREFIEHSLGDEGLARSVVIVATSDESPLLRLRAAKLACAASEGFREAGADVMLMMDSVTRFAHAQRQGGLSVGEPPATKGYTPSVFAELAQLLERAGASDQGGSVTGLYTILVEGDDMTEPISDAARGILDGHVVLSRALAHRGHYPAIDVLDSVSRVAGAVSSGTHEVARRAVSRLIARYREVEELVRIGAYAEGSDPETDVALELEPAITRVLQQTSGEREPFEHAADRLTRIAQQAEEMLAQRLRQRQRGG